MVNRADGHLDNSEIGAREHREEIVRVAEAWPEGVEIELGARGARDGRVAALAVVDGARDGGACEGGHGEPAQAAAERDDARVLVREAIAFDVVGFAARDRRGERGEIARIHLAVAGHHDERVARIAWGLQRGAIAGRDRRADAAIFFVADGDDARIGRVARALEGAVVARVVDHEDAIDFSRERREHAAEARGLAKGWDDDEDARHAGAQCTLRAAMRQRRVLIGFAVASMLVAVLAFAFHKPFPSDKTPEGAYARIAKAIAEQRPRDIFPYLEQDAEDAAFSIRDMRKAACAAIEKNYPAGSERDALLATYGPDAKTADAPDELLLLDARHGFVARLRADLSGAKTVEVAGDRATITTARGTRYSFRRRPNGIWGLTLFTAEMLADSERAARDLASVRVAADDYARAKQH